MVQGVGFRYFTQDTAEKLQVSGFVRNLRDGRVEVFAMASPQQHAELRPGLERGRGFSSVSPAQEEPAGGGVRNGMRTPDRRYEGGLVLNPSFCMWRICGEREKGRRS